MTVKQIAIGVGEIPENANYIFVKFGKSIMRTYQFPKLILSL